MKFLRLLPLFGSLLLASAAAQSPLASTPVKNFRLPTFTKEGHRSLLLQGTEARVSTRQVELSEMTLTVFSGDATNRVETVMLSPLARIDLEAEQVRGDGLVRVIRDDSEITGTGWSYHHAEKKVSITRSARVVFRAQLPDLLK